ncbi:MAG: ligand-binding sensor domain-containing protein [Candidatus Azotimanducaceae bacterium WSBS_2022_MAG_OTU7]
MIANCTFAKPILRYRLSLLTGLSFLLTGTITHSQNADIFELGELYFDSVEDYIPIKYGPITVLSTDQAGFLWIGTQAGLLRYDGYHFRHFHRHSSDDTSHTFRADFVRTLSLAADGRLWIGTTANGAFVFDPKTERFTNYRHNPDNPNSLSHDRVEAIVTDANGNVWMGTDEGLNYLDINTETFTHYHHPKENKEAPSRDQIRALVMDRYGDLWVGGSGGLNRIRAGTSTYDWVDNDKTPSYHLGNQKVLSLFESSNSNIWVGTKENGAVWIDTTYERLHHIRSDHKQQRALRSPINTITQVNESEIWLGSKGGGITVVDTREKKITHEIRHDRSVSSEYKKN